MSYGSIENLLESQINIRKLGWLIQALDTVEIPDEIGHSVMKRAETELQTKVAADTIVIRDSGAQIITSGAIPAWVSETWGVGGATTAKASFKSTALFKGEVKKHFKHWFKNSDDDSHLESGFQIMRNSHLKALALTVNKRDNHQTYAIQIYSDPAGTPVLIHDDVVTLTTNTRMVQNVDLNLPLTAGEYGLVIYRKSGTKDKSKFKKVRVEFQFEED